MRSGQVSRTLTYALLFQVLPVLPCHLPHTQQPPQAHSRIKGPRPTSAHWAEGGKTKGGGGATATCSLLLPSAAELSSLQERAGSHSSVPLSAHQGDELFLSAKADRGPRAIVLSVRCSLTPEGTDLLVLLVFRGPTDNFLTPGSSPGNSLLPMPVFYRSSWLLLTTILPSLYPRLGGCMGIPVSPSTLTAPLCQATL